MEKRLKKKFLDKSNYTCENCKRVAQPTARIFNEFRKKKKSATIQFVGRKITSTICFTMHSAFEPKNLHPLYIIIFHRLCILLLDSLSFLQPHRESLTNLKNIVLIFIITDYRLKTVDTTIWYKQIVNREKKCVIILIKGYRNRSCDIVHSGKRVVGILSHKSVALYKTVAFDIANCLFFFIKWNRHCHCQRRHLYGSRSFHPSSYWNVLDGKVKAINAKKKQMSLKKLWNCLHALKHR